MLEAYHTARAVVHHSKFGWPMSALGQKQTLQSVRPMSALPPKADIDRACSDVHFVPIADMKAHMDLRRSNRYYVNSTTDECAYDRAVNADVLKIATEDQFETVGYSPRVPVSYNLSD